MGLAVRKLDDYSNEFQVIKGQKQNKSKHLLWAIVLIAALAIITVPIILFSIDKDPDNEIVNDPDIDWNFPPCSPNELGPDWKEVTHELKLKNTVDRDFQNIKTNELIEFHLYNSVRKYKPHWHRHNPLRTSKFDYYLYKDGKPVQKDSGPSHIYTNCKK